jgi:hypothetical protein
LHDHRSVVVGCNKRTAVVDLIDGQNFKRAKYNFILKLLLF